MKVQPVYIHNDDESKVFYLGTHIFPKSLEFRIFRLRSEYEYIQDKNTEEKALSYLKLLLKKPHENIFLITAELSANMPSKVRSRKRLLEEKKQLKNLESAGFEIQVCANRTKFLSIAKLNNFNYDYNPLFMLSYMHSFILVTPANLSDFSSLCIKWLDKKKHSVIAFDYNLIISDLVNMPHTTLLRYFFADNGKPEALAFIGKNQIINTITDSIFHAPSL